MRILVATSFSFRFRNGYIQVWFVEACYPQEQSIAHGAWNKATVDLDKKKKTLNFLTLCAMHLAICHYKSLF
jgi:hypothetical protein